MENIEETVENNVEKGAVETVSVDTILYSEESEDAIDADNNWNPIPIIILAIAMYVFLKVWE